jgi:hypothetical protein
MRGRSWVFLGCFVLSNLSDAAFLFAKAATMSGSYCILGKSIPRMVLFCCKIEDGCVDTRLTGYRVRGDAPSRSDGRVPLAPASARRPLQEVAAAVMPLGGG